MENKDEDLRLTLSLRTSYLSDSTIAGSNHGHDHGHDHDHDHDHSPHDSNREMSEEEDGNGRKKLRLSKLQSSTLEDTFKQHHTLNPKEKMALAKQLNLRPRQVEVWFQNRRARKKLKKTEVDCEMLKKYCENLSEENRRLKKELMELKSIKVLPRNLPGGGGGTLLAPPTTTLLSICPSCERSNGGGGGGGVVAREQISGYRSGSSNISSTSFHRHRISSFY